MQLVEAGTGPTLAAAGMVEFMLVQFEFEGCAVTSANIVVVLSGLDVGGLLVIGAEEVFGVELGGGTVDVSVTVATSPGELYAAGEEATMPAAVIVLTEIIVAVVVLGFGPPPPAPPPTIRVVSNVTVVVIGGIAAPPSFGEPFEPEFEPAPEPDDEDPDADPDAPEEADAEEPAEPDEYVPLRVKFAHVMAVLLAKCTTRLRFATVAGQPESTAT